MSEVGIRALKQNASAVVAGAAAGELVTITDRGRAVAQMGPLAATRIETLIAADLARPALRRLRDLPAPARRSRGTTPLAEELEEMRRAERY